MASILCETLFWNNFRRPAMLLVGSAFGAELGGVRSGLQAQRAPVRGVAMDRAPSAPSRVPPLIAARWTATSDGTRHRERPTGPAKAKRCRMRGAPVWQGTGPSAGRRKSGRRCSTKCETVPQPTRGPKRKTGAVQCPVGQSTGAAMYSGRGPTGGPEVTGPGARPFCLDCAA